MLSFQNQIKVQNKNQVEVSITPGKQNCLSSQRECEI